MLAAHGKGETLPAVHQLQTLVLQVWHKRLPEAIYAGACWQDAICHQALHEMLLAPHIVLTLHQLIPGLIKQLICVLAASP